MINQASAITKIIQKDILFTEEEVWSAHRKLAQFNKTRLAPSLPENNWASAIARESNMRLLEGRVLQWEIEQVQAQAQRAPQNPEAFMKWFEDLKTTGTGQDTKFFDWLATRANVSQMTWFIQQEVAGEAGFDDLTALTQLKLPVQAKLEVARNYWDEMGRGHAKAMHGPMLDELAKELKIEKADGSQKDILPEALALGNVLLGFAINRRYAYHSIGALGAVELTAPGRAEKVHLGLKRLGISNVGQRYYKLHSTVDIKHSIEWNKEVIYPLVKDNPRLIPAIAEGALVRLNAGSRCFERYQEILEVPTYH